MRAITLFVMLLVTTVVVGCSDSVPPSPTEPRKLGPHRIPGRPSGAVPSAKATQP